MNKNTHIFLTASSLAIIFFNTFSMHLEARNIALKFGGGKILGNIRKKISFLGETIFTSSKPNFKQFTAPRTSIYSA